MKTLKFIIAAFITTLPVSAAAMCDWGMHAAVEEPVQVACAEGQTFDETAETCVDMVG
ncbi:MAG: hypothetical protein AAF618_00930 [Pseudomonadota bacterium]